ncbi:haloalkane dehalogenase [Andreprevotia lacus DSM 23236]|jgi:haloalkane dehalogenase|uniref:Haloalkane dehalogenase n=1 Tax=Andreprevotia lacus DSM 23236 TaxID=1121001 RepID=A0A1W1X914_9NEIS|nr:haloalkane dehalogenase [Andreprevotia lacus]SMC20307.1 haloalkane dehalogenase [Andreprevotia lacus DSM 23236]
MNAPHELQFEHSLQRATVLGADMAYRDLGKADGPVVLFLHGNPTSSYIWRNIIPHVAPQARCIAPDLIGYGQSGKPDIDYRFADHVRYLDALLDTLGIRDCFIVAQDWGTALAFHHAARFPERMRGLAFMEFIRPFARWADFHQRDSAREAFRKFRTPGEGEAMIMEHNVFIERIVPAAIMRTLSDAEMNAYRAPFPTPASRKPIWRLPNELPIEGQPADVHALLTEAHAALAASTYPKLLFAGTPGALVSPEYAAQFAAGLQHCELVQLGAGAHYLQEDHADAIGQRLAHWLAQA